MLQRRLFSVAMTAALALPVWAQAKPIELRVLTHSSFDVPAELIKRFESTQNVKLKLIKAGDAGEMLNKLILTQKKPIADAVFGIDNTLLPKTLSHDLLLPYDGPAAQAVPVAKMSPQAGPNGIAQGLVPVDHGYVNINYQKAWFESKGLALPTTLDQLTDKAYQSLLVMPNPNTSSTGFAFLLATIADMGEEKAFVWWGKMRANGLKVVKGWTEAYYTEFAQNGGQYPLVVSYASSPAAEVFYSKTKLTASPTGNVLLKGGVYQQVEGAGIVKGGQHPEKAQAFVEWLRSAPVQQALQTTMWMYPAQSGVATDAALIHSPVPTAFSAMDPTEVAANQKRWLARFSQLVLR